MAYVIMEPCVGVKDRSCLSVCPCDCIQEGTVERDGTTYDMLFIDPEQCIDCGLCESDCPVEAIALDIDVPTKWKHYIDINAEFYQPYSQEPLH